MSYPDNVNCHAVVVQEDLTMKCQICKKGFYLNKDGYCEYEQAPRCLEGQSEFKKTFRTKDLGTALFLQGAGPGCHRCDRGFVSVMTDRPPILCTQSIYLKEGLPANTLYIPNCKNYGIDPLGKLLCHVCQAEYVVTMEGKCVPQAAISNCERAISSNLCHECGDDFVLVNRACEAPGIDSCREYGNDASSWEQVCVECEADYYLENNVCHRGDIDFCVNYESVDICNSCEDGYVLVISDEGKSYCHRVNRKLHCKKFKKQQVRSGVLECETCEDEHIIRNWELDPNQFLASYCMKIDIVAHCKRYDIERAIPNSTFGCQECEEGFFFQNGKCEKRLLKLEECEDFDPNRDACKECRDGYFTVNDGKNCDSFPIGIEGCRVYNSKTECRYCSQHRYLRDNQCLLIHEDDRLDNCIFYDDPQICQLCDSGHANMEGVCVQAVAQNCLTYESENVCASCASIDGFKTENGIISCVAKNISSCLVSENEDPYPCITCENGFYPKDGVCTTATAIENC